MINEKQTQETEEKKLEKELPVMPKMPKEYYEKKLEKELTIRGRFVRWLKENIIITTVCSCVGLRSYANKYNRDRSNKMGEYRVKIHTIVETLEELFETGKIQRETKEKVEKFIEENRESVEVKQLYEDMSIIKIHNNSLLSSYMLSFSIELSCGENNNREGMDMIKEIRNSIVEPIKQFLMYREEFKDNFDTLFTQKEKKIIVEEYNHQETLKHQETLQHIDHIVTRSDDELLTKLVADVNNKMSNLRKEMVFKKNITRSLYLQRLFELKEEYEHKETAKMAVDTYSTKYVGEREKERFIKCLYTGYTSHKSRTAKSLSEVSSIVENCYYESNSMPHFRLSKY